MFRRTILNGTSITGLLSLVIFVCAIGSASAGEYEVWSCRGPDGQPLSTEAWEPRTNAATPSEVWVDDDCATGWPLTLHMTDGGITGFRRARLDLVFDLPRGAKISGYRMLRYVRAGAAAPPAFYAYGAAVRETTGGNEVESGCASFLAPPFFTCSFLGNPTVPDDPGNVVDRSGLDLDDLRGWVACMSAGCDPPFSPPAAEFRLFGSAVTIVDDEPPVITGIGGTVAGPDPVSGMANLFVEATDSNAGIASASLSIDGQPVETIASDASPTCAIPYEIPRPCPAEAGRLFTVDTSVLWPGAHVAAGEVVDAAGNSTPFGPVEFTVADPDPGPPEPGNGEPAVALPRLTLDRNLVQHRPRRPARVSGRLVTESGQPIAGARLDVSVTMLGSRLQTPRLGRPVTTSADGRFVVPMRGQGAKRVEVSFAPVIGGAATRSASATVRARLRLGMRPRPRRVRLGRAVTFRGRLVGAGPIARGVNVEVQARSEGRWLTVANVTTGAGGRFAWKYRFRYVDRDALFTFRALVRGNPGWPWPTVSSNRARVRIVSRGR